MDPGGGPLWTGRWPTVDPGGGPLWTREVVHYGPGEVAHYRPGRWSTMDPGGSPLWTGESAQRRRPGGASATLLWITATPLVTLVIFAFFYIYFIYTLFIYVYIFFNFFIICIFAETLYIYIWLSCPILVNRRPLILWNSQRSLKHSRRYSMSCSGYAKGPLAYL